MRQWEFSRWVFFVSTAAAPTKFFRFLGIPAPAEEMITGFLAMRHNAQRAGRFPRFEQWTVNLRRTLREIAGEVADELGYRI